jgi:glycosyltransferase involved in cell wall biosynthesis
MPANIKISIGIPTFNGASRIGKALDSILIQLTPEFATSIEVVISDNASTDNTSSVIASYIESFPCAIVYRKNDTNIGYDRNVNALFLCAVGQYVWLLADDDVLKPKAIQQVLNTFSLHNDLKIMQLNFQSYDSDMKQVVHEIKMSKSLVCEDAETFLSNSAGRYGQVSTLIFERQAWNQANVEQAYDTNYIHIYALLKVLLTGSSYIVKDPLVNVRTGSQNFGTTGDALIKTPLGAGKIFQQMRNMGYRKKISQRLLLENRRYVFRIIPHAKYKGIAHTIKLTRDLLAVHKSIELLLFWIPIIFLPMMIFRPLYRLARYLRQSAYI